MTEFFRRNLFFICIPSLILFLALVGYFYQRDVSYENPDFAEKNIEKSQSKIMAEKVGKLVFLHEDEIPTLATVSDPKLLKDQEFFADAKKGDVVLIYVNAKKAILYDPVANKIINMSTINVGNPKKSSRTISDIEGSQLKLPASSGGIQF